MQALADQQSRYNEVLNQQRATYEQSAAAAAQEIAGRATAGQQRATELANQLAASLAGEGISAQPLQAQSQLQQQLMQEANRYEQNYQTRVGQLAEQRFAEAERTGELMRQGAAGQLENQFASLRSALQRQRLQDILAAQRQIAEQEVAMQRAAAKAASSGGNSLRNTYLELQIAEKARKLQNPFAGQEVELLANYGSYPPEVQALLDPMMEDLLQSLQ